MKSIRIIVICFLLYAFGVEAKPVDTNMAKKVAITFLSGKSDFSGIKISDLKIAFTSSDSREEKNAFYAFNIGEHSYIVVSADDKIFPVLAYSSTSSISKENMPVNVKTIFKSYNDVIKERINDNKPADAATEYIWNTLKAGKFPMSVKKTNEVSPLIKTTWNQAPYYNKYCPYDSLYQRHTYTGCVATAMAQIIKYWEYPQKGFGTCTYGHPKYGYLETDYGIKNYDYDNMPIKLDISSTAAEVNAVAILMMDCGIGVGMDYGPNASAAFCLEQFGKKFSAEYALKRYFGYICGGGFCKYQSLSGWKDKVNNDLNNGQPILMAGGGGDTASSGHAFICDGYDNIGFYHFNFGWGGYGDGYFILDSPREFGYYLRAVFGIIPPYKLSTYNLLLYDSLNITSDTIYCEEDFTLSTKVINNGGKNFYGDLRLSLLDGQSHEEVAVFDTISCLTRPLKPMDSISLTFHGNLKKLNTKYYIFKIFYRDTAVNVGEDEWKMVSEIGNFYNSKNIKFEAGISETHIDSVSKISSCHAEIYAHVKNSCSETLNMKAIRYKKSSESSFKTVKDTSAGNFIKVVLDNLSPNTNYTIQSYVIVSIDNLSKTYTSKTVNFTTLEKDGISDFNENEIKVYPNPANRILNVHIPEKSDIFEIEIWNSIGQKISTQAVNRGINKILLREYAKGIYFLRLIGRTGNYNKKIIID